MTTVKPIFLFGMFCSILLFVILPARANNRDADKAPFHKRSHVASVALGLGLDYGYYGNYNQVPAISLMYDQGVYDGAGPGNIGVGGVFAVKSAQYKYGNGYKANWTNYLTGIRGTYHLTLLQQTIPHFDPYGGLTLGLRFSHYSDSYFRTTGNFPYSYQSVYPFMGIFAGAAYHFLPSWRAFTEFGYDFSYLRLGISYCIK